MFTVLIILYVFQWTSCFIANYDILRKRKKCNEKPSITLVRPFFGKDYAAYKNVFSVNNIVYQGESKYIYCLDNDQDPNIEIIKACVKVANIEKTKILIGHSDLKNPKLANLDKGLKYIDTDIIAMVDSNVSLDTDYLNSAVDTFYEDKSIGLVSAPPLAIDTPNFWSKVEAASLNTHQLRWQYVANFFSYAFAQGKNLIIKKEIYDLIGIKKLDEYQAEDAALTSEIRKLGLHVALMPPARMYLGPRSFKEFWNRQVRWARLRRKTFLLEFLPEILVGIVPILILLFICSVPIPAIISLIFIYYMPEIILGMFLAVEITPFYIISCLVRDLMMTVVWFFAWGNKIEWRGKDLSVNLKEKT